MLSSIKIENYRGFKSYQMNNPARVNLLVGKNSSGKTSLLESIFFLDFNNDSKIVAEKMREIMQRRGEPPFDDYLPDYSHLFHGRHLTEGPYFTIEEGNGLRYLRVRIPRNLPPDIIRGRQYFGTISIDGNSRVPLQPIQFLRPDSMAFSSMAKNWNSIVIDSRESEVVRAMKILEPSLKTITFLPDGTAALATFGDDTRRVPLGSHGDGTRWLLALSIGLALSNKGVLLVDEIDSGLHYSIMADMWKLVVQNAVNSDIQVFATTHSLDCVRGLAVLCDHEPALRPHVAIHKIEPTLEHSVVLSGEEISVAMEGEIEVR